MLNRAPARRTTLTRAKRLSASAPAVYLASALIASVAASFALHLSQARWTAPFYATGDATMNAMWFKTLFQTGWYEQQPLLSAPFGQVYHDYKMADHLAFLVGDLLNPITQQPFVTMNVYFVLGFPLAAITACWFLRLIGVRPLLVVPLSVLFALAPYHFQRGEAHYFLAAYYPVPLAVGIVYLAMRGRPLWALAHRRRGAARVLTSRAAGVAVALVVVGLSTTYYAFFTALLLGIAAGVTLLRTRRLRRAIGAVAAAVVVVGVVMINLLPDTLYAAANGTNAYAIQRIPNGVEVYALKIAQLILPVPGERIPVLAQLRQLYDDTFPVPSEDPALGVVGALGLLILIAVAVLRVAGVRGRLATPAVRERVSALSVLALVVLLFATVGGFSTFIGLFTSDLRGWNRISIFLLLLCLGAVGLGAQAVLSRMPDRPGAIVPKVVAVGLAVALLGVGYFDQVSTTAAPDHLDAQADFDQRAALVSRIEQVFGADASVAQLPVREFPESASASGVPDTDQVSFFLHSDTVRWTGGGIKGRPNADWLGLASASLTTPQLAASLAAARFDAVLLDTQYFGSDAASTVAQYRDALGAPRASAFSGRYVVFDLRPLAGRLARAVPASTLTDLGRRVVTPVEVRPQPDAAFGYKLIDLIKPFRPQLLLQYQGAGTRTVTVSFKAAFTAGAETVDFVTPAGDRQRVALSGPPKRVSMTIAVRPGQSVVDIEPVAGSAWPSHNAVGSPLQITDLTVDDATLDRDITAVSVR